MTTETDRYRVIGSRGTQLLATSSRAEAERYAEKINGTVLDILAPAT